MNQLGVTMPTRTVNLARVADYARWADDAGFDSAWVYELYRNPFSMLCLSAAATTNVLLATGLAAALPRSGCGKVRVQPSGGTAPVAFSSYQ